MRDEDEIDIEVKQGARRPKEPNVDFTKSPEFQAAVEKAAQEAAAKAVAAALAISRPGMAGESDLMMKQLAHAFREVTDEQQGIKRIPPDVLARYDHAREKMLDVIGRNIAKAEKIRHHETNPQGFDESFWPEYQIIGKVQLGDDIIQPFKFNPATKQPEPVMVFFLGIPNQAMYPINEAAVEVHDLFLESIGEQRKEGVGSNYWVTAKGLVIDGMMGVPVRQATKSPRELYQMHKSGPGAFSPGRKEINVLGTLAPPARQTDAGTIPMKRSA